jgi:hypothetical protein
MRKHKLGWRGDEGRKLRMQVTVSRAREGTKVKEQGASSRWREK